MKKAICSLLICFVLMGCSPSPEAIKKAIEQTQTAMPTPTHTPLSALQLDSLITQENDLPSGVSGAQISNEEGCDASGGNICADYYISQELSYKDNKRGEVEIWVYKVTTYNSLRYQNRIDSYIAECKKSVNLP